MSRVSGFCSHTEKALVRNRRRGGPVIPSTVSFTMCHAVNAAAAVLRPRGNGLQVPGSAQTLHSLRSATTPIYSSASPAFRQRCPTSPMKYQFQMAGTCRAIIHPVLHFHPRLSDTETKGCSSKKTFPYSALFISFQPLVHSSRRLNQLWTSG